MTKVTRHVLVCAGAGCVASGALQIAAALRDALRRRDLDQEVRVVETGCLGPCVEGPVAVVHPDGIFYERLHLEDVEEIVSEHLFKGRVVERLTFKGNGDGPRPHRLEGIAFFRDQTKIALRNCGLIDPARIEEYIARDGYVALSRVLTGMSPAEVIDTVKRSGLRGRGGAGFSTGLKWSFCRQAAGDEKYVLCNADEGDPGAFMDRSILEGDPHSVIEAMTIAAHAVGATQGFVYVRAEYPLAVKRLEQAIHQAREYGLLGTDIIGTGFAFDLEIRMGSGAFVCGEETALMTSIEGRRGEPRPRPPFPAQRGLWGKPSLLNNVETYASIPPIILRGAEWYASIGTEKSKGTKVFALAGAVKNTGLVEIPIGTPLGDIVFDIGGGVRDGKTFKAAQIGGPSGGCIPRQHLGVTVDYESLIELGAIMGSGGLIVMDDDTCMVDMARFFLEFCQDESCGKCSPCRIGTKRMLEIVERICAGHGEESDIDRLVQLGKIIQDSALCGLGQTAPNPVLSTIRHFRDEYVAHIRDRRCPAGSCPDLVRAPCQNACPAGVDVPGYVSLIGERRYPEALRLHRQRNPLAAVCARVCFHRCEDKCRRATIDAPVGIRGLKRFLVDQESDITLPEARRSAANARRRVAIIGAGPSGLSCAFFLARLGYRPLVLEAATRPGGMLVQAIPAYRLPRQIIAREIDAIQRLGVEIRTGVRLGRDVTLGELRTEGFEAIFLGVGAPSGRRLQIRGEPGADVIDALEFLRDYNLHGRLRVGRRVAVIGGGNAAIDAARTALRLGAESVSVLYRRTRAEMPAYPEEIAEAEREGVRIVTLVAPREIVRTDDRLIGVRCTLMTLGDFDASGRRQPLARDDELLFEADLVIAAIGQSLDHAAILGGTEVALSSQQYIAVDPITGRTSVDWLFAGGDAVLGPASVVDAVAGGERAAVGIGLLLSGKVHAFWREEQPLDTHFDPAADPVPTSRTPLPTLAVDRRRHNFDEVECTWTEAVALRESKRCLRCDYRPPAVPAEAESALEESGAEREQVEPCHN